MLQLKNSTPFPATLFSSPDPEGIDSLYVILKGTFTIGATVSIADEQTPISMQDQFTGEPGQSSIRLPSDISLPKPSTDVVLIGNAHSPRGKSTYEMEVRLSVGAVRFVLRVFGDRVWRRTAVGL